MRLRAVRRRLPVLAVVALTGAIAFPLGTIASHQFSDVPTSDQYHTDIDAIADAGVTLGCGGGKYCPDDFVTREQMAAFMNRLGALGPGKQPVVNADRLDGRDSADFLGAGDIVTQHIGPWQRHDGDFSEPAGAALLHYRLAGQGTSNTWFLPLPAPAVIDGVAYGLASVRMCVDVPAAQYVDRVLVVRVEGSLSQSVVNDLTDRADGCHVFEAAANEASTNSYTIRMDVVYPASTGSITIQNVHATWEPVG